MRVGTKALAGVGYLWAGLASASICYAEYLGLGAVLGPALLGYGDQSKSVGTLLVVLSAIVASLLLGLRKYPFLAGPRGASLSMLVVGLLALQSHFSVTASQQLSLLLCLMLGCAGMLWLAGAQRAQQLFNKLPAWLVPSFMYASAVGIAAGAVSKYLYSCLQIAPVQTWGIFFSTTLIGILWPKAFDAIAFKLTTAHPRCAAIAKALRGLALVVAAGFAWVAYEFSALHLGQSGQCARLGRVDLDLHMLAERTRSLLHFWDFGPPAAALLGALVLGIVVGGISAIENLTAIKSLLTPAEKKGVTMPAASDLLRLNAASNVLLGAATTVTASLSQSRTQLLWNLGRPSHWAVLFHALALAAIAVLISHWLAWLPQLALAVLMTLVATQMVGEEAVNIWKTAYDPTVITPGGLRAGLGLWLVLGITAVTGQVLLAFVLPAAMYWLVRYLRIRRLRHRKPRLPLAR